MRGKFYGFSKLSPSDFLQSDFFQKNNKKNQEYLQYQTVWIKIRSNVCWALFARNVKPDLDTKLFLVDGILFALSMYALNGFFLPIICINLGMFHYILRGHSL